MNDLWGNGDSQVLADRSSYERISGNTLHNGGNQGAYLVYSDYNSLLSNQMANTGWGVRLDGSHWNLLVSNTLSSSVAGIAELT
ncbi:right-handed parallel beta-helix repeat-containing protein, partial [Klebsiella pneumoniae]|nr:right-handed parallel beta-helix repeat-containing protein [Klebsiella pneumoniae]